MKPSLKILFIALLLCTFAASCEKDSAGEDPSTPVVTPDPHFKAYLVSNFDENEDGEISVYEASLITKIDCQGKGIQSLEGIQSCTSLTSLDCKNNQLETLDVSRNTALTVLDCYGNQLTSLDVSKNTALIRLYCESNQLNNLNVSGCAVLKNLFCSYNQLTTLDVDGCVELRYLECDHNSLNMLDLSKTNIGNSTSENPLNCGMSTLKTLYLKTGWEINNINVNRNPYYIFEQTEILYKD